METVASYNSAYYTPARWVHTQGFGKPWLLYSSAVQCIDRMSAEQETAKRNQRGPDGWFVVRVDCTETVQSLQPATPTKES